MVDVSGIQLPWGQVSTVLPRLGRPSPFDRPLEAAAATSITDLYTIGESLSPLVPTSPTGSNLGQQLSLVSTLINANVPTRVWEVNLSSFDTHVGEQADQNALLAEVDAAVGAFMTSISAGSRSNDVTVMIYSEFGRRVESNAGARNRPWNVGAGLPNRQRSHGRPLRRTALTRVTGRKRKPGGDDGLSRRLRRIAARRAQYAGGRHHSGVEYDTFSSNLGRARYASNVAVGKLAPSRTDKSIAE